MSTATRSAGARPAIALDAAADVVPKGRGLLGVGHVLMGGSPLPPRWSAEGDEAGARGDAMSPWPDPLPVGFDSRSR